jgi:serine-protein kinase ATM
LVANFTIVLGSTGDRHLSNVLIHENTGEVIHIDFGIVFEQGKVRLLSAAKPLWNAFCVSFPLLWTTFSHRCLKRLQIPELVPFRLTQNVVDAMGPMGTEGGFMKTAEETLSLLRQNAHGLETIVSSVLADPQYHWSENPEENQSGVETICDDHDDTNPGSRDNDTAATSTRRSRKRRGNGDENGSVSDEPQRQQRQAVTKRDEFAVFAMRRITEKLQGFEDDTGGEQQSVESQVKLLVSAACDPGNLCQMFLGWAPFI